MENPKTREIQVFSFKHSIHSFERSSQRGMNSRKLVTALAYGMPYYKQGLIFYVLGENNIPQGLEKNKTKLKNTIVVVDGDSGMVITCYRCSKPHKHVKHKTKITQKKYFAA